MSTFTFLNGTYKASLRHIYADLKILIDIFLSFVNSPSKEMYKGYNFNWFEIRIVHRILATNSLLQKVGILLDTRCSFGCGEEETIIHLFCHCRFVEPFWRRIHSLINVKCNLNIPEWNHVDILFGNKTLDKVINQIILQAKFYIYKSRVNKFSHMLVIL